MDKRYVSYGYDFGLEEPDWGSIVSYPTFEDALRDDAEVFDHAQSDSIRAEWEDYGEYVANNYVAVHGNTARSVMRYRGSSGPIVYRIDPLYKRYVVAKSTKDSSFDVKLVYQCDTEGEAIAEMLLDMSRTVMGMKSPKVSVHDEICAEIRDDESGVEHSYIVADAYIGLC